MKTVIGQYLNSSPRRLAAASVVAAAVVVADAALVLWNRVPVSIEGRGALALIALAVNLWLVQGDVASLGLRLSPAQGWRYWFLVSLWIGIAVAACIVVGLGAWSLSGHKLTTYVTAPRDVGASFLHMCVFAPVLEEAIYRLVLCLPLCILLGPWRAIVVSGVVFAALHIASGNPSPENQVGGFFLAWAFVKSESIVVPVLLHSLGNAFALMAQVGAWYWLTAVG